ncbi:glycosyltransferase family 4 protein [Sphingomonas sp.]|jgi:glycosyltransferase involved in cell wall biosynthesis|uniref:glycosyltransferase family 4 protein n=1 Tax=Sphingomonas sp. TaxID=28214 RepID=UPI002E3693B6|nr:glycosyltransferase family 4 protein [Sphingomonas sp.]HEX4695914.1 glycosyltransferase family 4 protein [Sphingomonas sp.]
MKTRLAIVVTHPIQHFVPFYRALAADPAIELHVLYGAPIGVQAYFDEEMQAEISWNMDMLGGYSHEFLGPVPDDGQPCVREPNSPKVADRLAAFAPDVVLVYGHVQANVHRAIRWCRSRRVPLMTIGDSELLRERTTLTRAVKDIVVRWIFRRYSAFLSVGDRNADFYRHYGAPADRIFRCPFTIDEAAYRAAKANRAALRSEARATYGIADDAVVALFVGKLSSRKRPVDLIEAVARVKGAKVTALFAGNGDQLAGAKARAEATGVDARFAGFVNVDQLPALYAAADMLVHPSGADPHPLICSEGACIGLPMILSDRIGAVGPTDIAREGENALVFPCGDIAALAGMIETLATDGPRRDAMGRRSLEIFDECDLAASVAGIHRGIEAALARPR